MPARQLGEADARRPRSRRETHGAQHVMRPERGLEQALEEIPALTVRLPFVPMMRSRRRAQRGRRQFGGRIRIGERAANGAAIADRRMRDVRHRQRDQRRMFRDVGGALQRTWRVSAPISTMPSLTRIPSSPQRH
jgi:hypothetical protein